MSVNERTFVRHSGTLHENYLSDSLINDVEHPEFVNSLSDDEDVRLVSENNIVPASGTFIKKTAEVLTDPGIDLAEVHRSLLPPPTSSACFIKSLQGGGNLSLPPTVSLQTLRETFLKSITDAQEEARKTIERKKEKQAEVEKLKESINSLQNQKQQMSREYEELVPRCEKELNDLKVKLLTYQKLFKKNEDKLQDKQKEREKLKEKLDTSKRKYEAVKEEDAELTNWTLEHNIDIHIKVKSSPDCGSMDEVVIELYNINPQDPEKRFHILADSMASSGFSVSNVFPEFDGAYEAIERANYSQDLLQLLRDCKNAWQRDCAKLSIISDRQFESTGAHLSPDQTMELFEQTPARTRKRKSISENVEIKH